MNLSAEQKELLKKALGKDASNSTYLSLTAATNGAIITASDVGQLSDGTIIVCGSGPVPQNGGGTYPVMVRVAPDLTYTVFNSFVKDAEQLITGSATGLCVVNDNLIFMTYNISNKAQGASTQLPYIGVVLGGVLAVEASFELPLGANVKAGNANSVYVSLAQGLIVTGSVGASPSTVPVVWEVTYDSSNPLTPPTLINIPLKNSEGAGYGDVRCASFVGNTTYVGGDMFVYPGKKYPTAWTVNGTDSSAQILPNNPSPYGVVLNSSQNGLYLCGYIYVPGSESQSLTGFWAWNGTTFNFIEFEPNTGAKATLVNNDGTILIEVLNDPNAIYIATTISPYPFPLLEYLSSLGTANLPASLIGFTLSNLAPTEKVMVGNAKSDKYPQEAWMITNLFPTGLKKKQK